MSDTATAEVLGRLSGLISPLQKGMTAPVLPVRPVLQPVLPAGLARGITAGVSGSVSLLLSLLGSASEQGAWSALVGFGSVSAEAVTEHGLDLARVAFVPSPGAEWVSVVGVLLDSVDLVVIRPPARLAPGEVRRLAARARTKSAVLIGYGPAVEQWPGLDLRLHATTTRWVGAEDGYGRLRGRELEIRAEGRGRYARPLRDLVWFGEAPRRTTLSVVEDSERDSVERDSA
jgi:hypothetical protein